MGKVQIWEQLIIFAGNPESQTETSHLTGYPLPVRPLLHPACLSFASFASPVPTRSYTALCRYTRPVSSPLPSPSFLLSSARPTFLSGLQLAPTLRRTRGKPQFRFRVPRLHTACYSSQAAFCRQGRWQSSRSHPPAPQQPPMLLQILCHRLQQHET